ncbi:MAG: ParB/RepB/Spo0J family partition protein, partial [Flammeovirgaceae bacterium]
SSLNWRLSKKMKENGFDPAYPIEVVDIDGKLLIRDGNHRRAAAINRGISEVPYVKVDVSPEEAESLLIGASNALEFRKY